MGQRELLAGGIALIFGWLPAQGPVYRERHAHAALEQLRSAVHRALEGRDAATVAAVAALLAEPANAGAVQAPARALARLRGVPADDAFLLRAALHAFVLPEVADPSGTNEVCRQVNVSLALPLTLPAPGALSFLVEARDASGAVVFTTELTANTTVADLRAARPVAKIPCADLPDGRYEVRVRTRVDAAEPKATDPVLVAPFHVLRGYQARAERGLGLVRDLAPQLPPLPRALLVGIGSEVERAYLGEAADGTATPVLDLERLETSLQNLEQGRHVLHGLAGDVPVALPGGDRGLGAVLRLAAGRNPAAKPGERPLVVFVPGSPALDLHGSRPAAPATRSPRWPAEDLRGFGADLGWDVAFLESPGGGRNYGLALQHALQALRELWPAAKAPVVLVAERDAAAIVGLQWGLLQLPVQGLVLLGGGAMPAATLDQLGAVRVRVGFLRGSTGNEGLQRALDYLANAASGNGPRADYQRLPLAEVPWTQAFPAHAGAITTFLRALEPQ